ncbi:MAG: SGNH/GDSL hydrolase family protein [Planctomycetota bacterium]
MDAWVVILLTLMEFRCPKREAERCAEGCVNCSVVADAEREIEEARRGRSRSAGGKEVWPTEEDLRLAHQSLGVEETEFATALNRVIARERRWRNSELRRARPLGPNGQPVRTVDGQIEAKPADHGLDFFGTFTQLGVKHDAALKRAAIREMVDRLQHVFRRIKGMDPTLPRFDEVSSQVWFRSEVVDLYRARLRDGYASLRETYADTRGITTRAVDYQIERLEDYIQHVLLHPTQVEPETGDGVRS